MAPATAHSYQSSFPTRPSVARHTCGNNQWAPRIAHSWHCRAYIFHTQATVLQNTPAHPVPLPAPGPAVVSLSLLPSLSVFEPFFTSVAAPWQADCSDKIHDYTQENLIEKRCVVKKKKTRVRRTLSSCLDPALSPSPSVDNNGGSQNVLLRQRTLCAESCICLCRCAFTQVGRSRVESYCDDKRFPQQWQGQISGRRHTQTQGEAVCLAVKIASKQSQKHRLGMGGWTVEREATRWSRRRRARSRRLGGGVMPWKPGPIPLLV